MYYSLLIEFTNALDKKMEMNSIVLADDQDLDKIIKEVVEPYLNNDNFIVDGYMLNQHKIKRIKVVSSKEPIREIMKYKQDRLAPEIFYVYKEKDIINDHNSVTDITNEILNRTKQFISEKEICVSTTAKENFQKSNRRKVFIVYGRDKALWTEVARFLEKLQLEPIILQEQANLGRTIIEKIEEYTDVGYGVVLTCSPKTEPL